MKMRSLLTVAIGLASVTGAALLYGAKNDAEGGKAALERQLQEMLKTHVASARSALEVAQPAYEASNATFNDLADATKKLAEAEVAAATRPAEEVAALGAYVERTRQAEANIKALLDLHGRGGDDYYAAKRERESAEILLLKARIKATP